MTLKSGFQYMLISKTSLHCDIGSVQWKDAHLVSNDAFIMVSYLNTLLLLMHTHHYTIISP